MFCEEVIYVFARFPSDSLGLRPFWFDWIEVWAIGRQIFEGMACVFDHRFCVVAFVEGCVIHDDHSAGRQFGQQIVLEPKVKDICINVGSG